jgi:predicted extracellular nuclease
MPGPRLPLAALAATLVLAAPAAAASPDVVISQVYGGGGNSGAPLANDYVELFNRSGSAVPVAGWSVQYASAAGTSWANKADLAGEIPAGGFYLVALAGGANGAPLPPADATGTVNMSATNGKVALVTSTTPLSGCGADCSVAPGVRDFVGYGSADDAEGSPAPALDAQNAAVRLGGGCQDTDANAADFARAAPAPRTTAVRAPCSGPQPPVAACGGPLAVVAGDPAERAVSATDPDGRVTELTLSGGGPGIALDNVTPSPADGEPATATVTVAADVPAGTYATTLTAGNAAGETGTCALTITVAPFAATPIGAIQGSGYASPLAGQRRSLEGVVTGFDDEIGQSTSGLFPEDRGLFVQDAGDGDDTTSDGIFVAEILDAQMLARHPIGTRVRVTGVVREKFDQTILDTDGAADAVQARGAGPVPEPVTLDPALAKAQASDPDGRAYYERFEGMRVRVAEATANSGGTNKFGELFLTLGPEQDRVFRTDVAQDLIAADSDAGAGNPAVPYLDPDGSTTTVHADLFDRVTELVGPMSYDFSNYRVVPQPGAPPAVDRTPGPAYPYDRLAPSGPGELRIASFNVENFFGPGAELDGGIVGDEDYAEKKARIVDAIGDLLERPDVVAVQEVDELAILQEVAADLGGYTAYLREGNDNRGIDVGFLVKDGVTATNLRQWGKAATETVASTCSDIPGRLFDRPPLSIDVSKGDVALTVFSNHFASKSGNNQDCRIAQAQFVADAVAGLGGEALVSGDLNDFEDEGAPTTLGRTMTPLWGLAPEQERYSFQFSGRLQTLDHMFVTPGLAGRVRHFTYAHFDNDYFERPDPADGHHVSDHDPPVVTLRVATPPVALALPAIIGRPQVGARLFGVPGVWRDADSLASAWLRCTTAERSSCAPVGTGLSYRVTRADRDAYLRLEVTATGDGGTAVASSPPVRVR